MKFNTEINDLINNARKNNYPLCCVHLQCTHYGTVVNRYVVKPDYLYSEPRPTLTTPLPPLQHKVEACLTKFQNDLTLFAYSTQ